MNPARRLFLARGAALGCSAAASPLFTRVALASGPTDRRLIVIILRGAMDGLAAVQPYGDPAFAALRPGAGPDGGARDLDGFFAMHAELGALMPMWRAGELAFAHAVSTPYRDMRSHFDGQDLLEAGLGNAAAGARHADGWLNRLVQDWPGATRDTALAVGREEMLILKGRAETLSWSPAAGLALSPGAEELLTRIYHDDRPFQDAYEQARYLSADVFGLSGLGPGDEMEAMRRSMDEAVRESDGRGVARFVAERMRGDARVASFSINGWDTHRNQEAALGRSLARLAETLITLKSELGPQAWGQTAVLAMTEFGRTARINGSNGTDHGTGGAMVLAGGALRGGRVLGDWPGLAEADLYDRRDLMPTQDVRRYAAWAMAGLFGTSRAALESRVFPGLDIGDDPGLLL